MGNSQNQIFLNYIALLAPTDRDNAQPFEKYRALKSGAEHHNYTTSPLYRLPYEIMLDVFAELDDVDRFALRLVSRRFYTDPHLRHPETAIKRYNSRSALYTLPPDVLLRIESHLPSEWALSWAFSSSKFFSILKGKDIMKAQHMECWNNYGHHHWSLCWCGFFRRYLNDSTKVIKKRREFWSQEHGLFHARREKARYPAKAPEQVDKKSESVPFDMLSMPELGKCKKWIMSKAKTPRWLRLN